MTFKTTGVITLIDLLLVILWLIFMVAGIVLKGPIDSLDAALRYAANQDWMFIFTYVNAVMLTLVTTWVFGGVYVYCKPLDRQLSLFGIMIVPVYCLVNLFAYLSQITILPELLRYFNPAADMTEQVILGQLIQAWPASAVARFNNFAYALLGLPSIAFGRLLMSTSGNGSRAGLFLMLNGIACIIGFIGLTAGSSVLGTLSVLGGILFVVALMFLARMFLGTARTGE